MAFWKDKTVWITGASSGIGKALAEELAPLGARLILSSRRMESLEAVRQSLANAERHQCISLDVSDPVKLSQVLTEHGKALSQVDVLFNNAGISQRAYAWEASSESERMVMETNFFGAVAVAKIALEGMMQRNRGNIAVLSSVTGKFGFPLRSSYAASKHALHGYFDSLRAELKDTAINVSMICPGRINTNVSVNAITADGSAHNQMDPGQASGIPADKCARIIINGVANGQAEMYIGKEKALVYLKRFFPALFRRVIRRIKPT